MAAHEKMPTLTNALLLLVRMPVSVVELGIEQLEVECAERIRCGREEISQATSRTYQLKATVARMQ
jgi:hypothetical protein